MFLQHHKDDMKLNIQFQEILPSFTQRHFEDIVFQCDLHRFFF
uniref:Uncharacterized protein n=1 Tax=Anguilla anguilla TaxID=7936 RepID=A0A0E9WM45_ANGAN